MAGSHGLPGKERTALVSILAAMLLVVMKLTAGLASGSLGLVAEALHSAGDLVAATLTFVAVRVGARPPDRRHPWGHGRAEHLAALVEGMLLMLASAAIAWQAVARLLGAAAVELEVGPWTLAVGAAVIIIDVGRTASSHRAAREYQSPALASNAVHFAGDLAGSIAVFVGLIAVNQGIESADAIAALVVSAIVALAAGRLVWANAQVLMDVAPPEAEAAARRAVLELDLPLSLRRVRVRRSAGGHLADMVIGVGGTEHVAQGHAIADAVEEAVRRALPDSDVVVHVEPDERSATIRDQATAAALAHPGIHEVHNVTVLVVEGIPEISMHLKVSGELRLDRAHDLADMVEADVHVAVPGTRHVDLHIEPMDRESITTAALVDERLEATVRAVVQEYTASPARDVRLRRGRKGLSAYVTVVADAGDTLRAAHALATSIEDEVCRREPAIAEVVVHTEPC